MTKEHTPNKVLVHVIKTKISQDLKQKLDKLFVDLSSDSAKVRCAVSEYFKFVEKYPYLNISQETVTPEDAGFIPCPFVKAIYWDGEFLGFHCRARKPPAFKLPTIRVGRLNLQVTTPEDCIDCRELCRINKVGIDIFSNITTKQIALAKERIRKHKWKYTEDSTTVASTRIHTKGKAGRAKVNRQEAFKLFSKGCPKKFIKNQLRIAEATYFRIQREYDALTPTEKDNFVT
ncbi:hypothetical protein ES703_63440 [subsurface metagenome]